MGKVIAVARDRGHNFSKQIAPGITLIAGRGVAEDAHEGATVQHRSRVAADPTQPILRQVHLIHAELLAELSAKGFAVKPADLGENITTSGIDLLALPQGTTLKICETVVLAVTGLRNPCAQIDRFQKGLLAAVVERGPNGELIRKAGIMAIVKVGGMVGADDPIRFEYPTEPHWPLQPA